MSGASNEEQFFRGMEIARKFMGDVSKQLNTVAMAQENIAANLKNLSVEFSRVRNDLDSVKTRLTIVEANATNADANKVKSDISALSTKVILIENRIATVEDRKAVVQGLSSEDVKTISAITNRLTAIETTQFTREEKESITKIATRVSQIESRSKGSEKTIATIATWLGIAVAIAAAISSHFFK